MEEWDKESIIKFHEGYEGEYAGDTSAPEIVRLSKNFIGTRVLDVGAGSGALIDLIPKAIGLDLVSKHPRMIKGDVSIIPFKTESFDTIFATDILEHLDDETLKRAFCEIARILKTKGSLILATPYKENLKQNIVLCPKCGTRFHKVGHFQTFEEKTMEKLLITNGFKIRKISALPLSFMANHKYMKYFKSIFERFGYVEPSNLFVIAVKE